MKISSRNELGKLLAELKLDGNGIEIGVCKCDYSKVIINTFPLKKIYLLDAWKHYDMSEYPDGSNYGQEVQDKLYQNCLNFAKQYGDKVVVIRKESAEGSKDFENNFFDFIYIDANHTYKYVAEDMRLWYPKLKKGGLFAGHDYVDLVVNGGKWGVKTAVDEFVEQHNENLSVIIERKYNGWYFVKTNN